MCIVPFEVDIKWCTNKPDTEPYLVGHVGNGGLPSQPCSGSDRSCVGGNLIEIFKVTFEDVPPS